VLTRLEVEQGRRDGGIGRELIGGGEEYAIASGCWDITLGVHPTNTAAQQLYFDRGYRDWGNGPLTYHDEKVAPDGKIIRTPETFLVLAKMLPHPALTDRARREIVVPYGLQRIRELGNAPIQGPLFGLGGPVPDDVVLPWEALPGINLTALTLGMKAVSATRPEPIMAAIRDLRPNEGFSVSGSISRWAATPHFEAIVQEGIQTTPISNIFPVLAREDGPPPFPENAWAVVYAKSVARDMCGYKYEPQKGRLPGLATYPRAGWANLFHTGEGTEQGIKAIAGVGGESARSFHLPCLGVSREARQDKMRSLVGRALDASWPLIVDFDGSRWFALSRVNGTVWAHIELENEPWYDFDNSCPWRAVSSVITLPAAGRRLNGA
jgi:hypothetical protein